MNRETSHRAHRRRDRGGFRVVQEEDDNGEEVYALVGPTGVTLYTFVDLREADAEAAELNSLTRRGSTR